MQEKNKPKYSVFQNTIYLLKMWWQWDKKNLLLVSLRIPALVLLPFLAIYMPKAVINCLTSHVSPQYLIMVVAAFTLMTTFLYWTDKYLEGKIRGISLNNRMHHLSDLFQKSLDTDYENMESPDGQIKLQKAFYFINTNRAGGEAIVNAILMLAVNSLGMILYSSVLSTLNPVVLLFLVSISLINFLTVRQVENYEYKNKDAWAAIDKKLSYLRDTPSDFPSGKDIRLYNISSWFTDIYNNLLTERISWIKKVQKRWFAAGAIEGILTFLRDGISYGYLIYLVLKRQISVADFILFFGAIAGFSTWVSGIITEINEVRRISLDCCNFRDFLEMPDKFNRGMGIPLPQEAEFPCDIVFENVTFQYPGTDEPTIKNLNLHIKKGEKIAIVGRNGAGKTTCIKLLCGLYRPTSGKILINGKDSLKFNRDEYYKLFTAVFQDTNFLPISIRKNITLCNNEKIDSDKLERCLKSAGLWERINKLDRGLETLMLKEVNDNAADFSGGELQKLLLARALYKDAPIIILDEPTAALDPIAENNLYQKYSDLTSGHTSLFISHRLSSTRFCDRIIFVDGGSISEEGTHDQLMAANGGYAEMFNIQSHYYKENLEEGAQIG